MLLKDIPGFEGSYAVTVDGRVWSHPKPLTGAAKGTRQGRWLKQSLAANGYKKVNLGSESRNMLVHRLVALAHIPNPLNKKCVNHLNGDKTDNSVDNLVWATHSENSVHAFETRLKAPPKGLTQDQADDVKRLYRENRLSQKDIAIAFGVGRSTIQRCVNSIGY